MTIFSLSPARTFALDSVNHKEQQHNITIRVSMRRRRSRIGRQGGNRMAAVFNLVMATLRVGEIHYNLSTLSQIHSYLGELMCKIQFRYLNEM